MEDNLVKAYSNIYLNNKTLFTEQLSKFILPLREKALNDFLSMGIPKKKLEKYKYIDLEPIFNRPYDFYLKPDVLEFNVEDIFQCDVPQFDMQEVLVVNGFYYHKNKLNGWQPDGSWIGGLNKALKEIPEIVEKYINKTYTSDDGLLALNNLLFRDGLFVYVPKNKTLAFPLQLIDLLIYQSNLFNVSRNLIVLEDNAQANIVFCNHTLSSNQFLSSINTEIILGENANIQFTWLQNIHNQSTLTTHTNIYQSGNSRVNSTILSLHGGLIRNNISVKLDGEGAENYTNGLYLTDGNQLVDNYVFIDHAKPHCTSNQLFKGILDDASNATFSGRILVDRDSQKTSAFQKCSNILLTSTAKVNARPLLEIFADDVKCTHGATVGQLDNEAMFYLRSRGISEKEARFLLMFAFAHEITQNIPLENLRFRLNEIINKRLRKEIGRCHNCQITVS